MPRAPGNHCLLQMDIRAPRPLVSEQESEVLLDVCFIVKH